MRLLKKYNEVISYVFVGGLTTSVNMLLFYGSVWTFLDGGDALQLQLANVISWAGAVLFAYFANRKYVFRSTNKRVLKEMFAFIVSRVMTLLLDIALMYFITSVLLINYSIAKLISIAMVMVLNYILGKIVF